MSIFFIYLIPQIYAVSVYFPRQEITDDIYDAVKKNSYENLTKVNYNPFDNLYNYTIEEKIADSIDISHITYLSDGKTLNATLWLNSPRLNELVKNETLKTPHKMVLEYILT
jgi:hypothetical protein